MAENQLATQSKFNNFTSVDEIKGFATEVLASGLLPSYYKTPEQVAVAVLQGKEIGLEPMSAMNNIAVIDGKPSLGIHVIAALIKRAGIFYELVEDAVWYREDGTVDKFKITKPVPSKDDPKKMVKGAAYNYVDCATTIKFHVPMGNGQYMTQSMSFFESEAKAQGLLEKSNWKKMFRIMMRTRCLAIGARFVAPEALLGFYETTELLDAKNIAYEAKDNGDGFADFTIIQ